MLPQAHKKKKMKTFTIYTTKTCPFCDFAKDLLKDNDLAFEEKDLTGDIEAREKLAQKAAGRTSVPQVFLGETHIGGYEDLKKWLEENL